MVRLKIGYSPCPNDTYIMAALALGKIKAPVFLEPVLSDVETLNQWALEGRLEVTKLSFFALGKALHRYGLLNSGAALGKGCGPIVVARPGTRVETLAEGVVAAPGALTTARLLLSLYLGKEPRYHQKVFSEVMPAVARKEADFGLVIHEGRFTYVAYGLVQVMDLGKWWEKQTGGPVPLGGIAVRRDLPAEIMRAVDKAVSDSLNYADAGGPGVLEYVKVYAREMDSGVIRQHIGLYVNDYSKTIGSDGERAVKTLFFEARKRGWIPDSNLPFMAYAGDGDGSSPGLVPPRRSS